MEIAMLFRARSGCAALACRFADLPWPRGLQWSFRPMETYGFPSPSSRLLWCSSCRSSALRVVCEVWVTSVGEGGRVVLSRPLACQR